MRLSHLFRSVWKQHSLFRAHENNFLRGLRLSGRGIDLGAKSRDAKYYEYLDLNRVSQIDFVDLFSQEEGIIKLDLEQRFPILDETYDFALAFNVMEHLYDYRNLIAESRRILRTGGTLHGLVPFMFNFHADPHDYFRFTWQALQRLLQDERFDNVRVVPIAYGPFQVAGQVIGNVLRARVFRFLIYPVVMILDEVLENFYSGATNYAIGYYFCGVKHSQI
jgi:SAM-dependent methyltransferase